MHWLYAAGNGHHSLSTKRRKYVFGVQYLCALVCAVVHSARDCWYFYSLQSTLITMKQGRAHSRVPILGQALSETNPLSFWFFIFFFFFFCVYVCSFLYFIFCIFFPITCFLFLIIPFFSFTVHENFKKIFLATSDFKAKEYWMKIK
jgi:hypothetical protein